jgi:hypothetical protein
MDTLLDPYVHLKHYRANHRYRISRETEIAAQPVASVRRALMPRPRALAVIAVCIRILPEVDERRRRLMDLLDKSTPELFAEGLELIEAQIASETAETVAAE